jgi:hypothetical protein
MASMPEFERLIHAYQAEGIPARFMFAHFLWMGDEMAPDEFIEAFPEELRHELEDWVSCFRLSNEPHLNLRPDLRRPQDETILALRNAFTRRRQTGNT